MHPLERYLTHLHEIRSTGAAVKETSYYPALANLLDEVGKDLKPRVRCVLQLANRGAGHPDGGFFTAHQLRHVDEGRPLLGQTPERGVIEVKSPADSAWLTAEGSQVSKYWAAYGLVLVTNYRDFVLLARNADGKPEILETYQLAPDETSFWDAARTRRTAVARHGDAFVAYLKRAMLHTAPLIDPKDVAWFLASYAKDAKARVEAQKDLQALATLKSAMEESLGLQFAGPKGDQFFRSTLVQTLFYGIFAAWVIWHKNRPQSGKRVLFDWRLAGWYLRVPVIRALFEQVSMPTKMEPLGLVEVLEWATAALNRVDRDAFFARFEENQAVQYFYEPFLEAFDPALRKELGVWYTPPEIVKYMVSRVDSVLRTELGLEDGLANPRVYVLDPCAGTGSFLVEVLRHVAGTLEQQGADALTGDDLKRMAVERLFGFEILPAPFVIAHLQLGLLLQSLGAPLSESRGERAGVYLTNALTGWDPEEGPHKQLVFKELEEERDAAEHVKRDTPILVVLGNPPYNAFAEPTSQEERNLVEPYKAALRSEWGAKRFQLDDLYARFFRLAERRVVEMTKQGVVCYISSFSYLFDPQFVVMRQRFLEGFDEIWIDCMNGDSRETGKKTPDGKPDPSVFSTPYNREGIKVGTAISLMVRKDPHHKPATVLFRQLWGTTKREDLQKSLTVEPFGAQYQVAHPGKGNWFSFRHTAAPVAYSSWPSVHDLAEFGSLGLIENRKGALFSIDREPLAERMRRYYDPQVAWEELKVLGGGLVQDAARFDPQKTRTKALATERFQEDNLRRFLFNPMDIRWCYYTQVRPVWNEPRPAYAAQMCGGNATLVTRQRGFASPEGVPVFYTSALGFQHAWIKDAYYFPLRLVQTQGKRRLPEGQTTFLDALEPESAQPQANLSARAREYLAALGITNPDAERENAQLVWMHVLAIGHAPSYLTDNAEYIRADWLRVPVPSSAEVLRASAQLGQKISSLLDTLFPVPGVTTGDIRPELRCLAVISRVDGGKLVPNSGDLALSVGWGHLAQGGIVMPGKGRVEHRSYRREELDAIAEGARAFGLSEDQALACLGDDTYDIYLNDVAYWRNVPRKVWEYTIGGYHVMKKWLSYREHKLLGRPLTKDETREVTHMARRVAATLLLSPLLDENFQHVKDATWKW